MARLPRQFSDTCVYHIITRGNNKERIFSNDSDKRKYISLIKSAKEKFGFKIFSFALMDNHLHLLIKIDNEVLSNAMKFIQQSYSNYFNNKYQRTGRVFEGRFKSKSCKDDIYLIELIKYIHKNPERAGLNEIYTNLYTSYNYYFSDDSSFVDVDYILSIFSDDKSLARKLFADSLNMPSKFNGKDIYNDLG